MNNELGQRIDQLKNAVRRMPVAIGLFDKKAQAQYDMVFDMIERLKEDYGLIHRYDAHVRSYREMMT